MSKHNEQELLLMLKEEFNNSSSLEPSDKQDAIFQESLDQHLSQDPSSKNKKGLYWLVAASVFFLVGVAVIFSEGNLNHFNGYQKGLPELITASNEIERELSGLEAEDLDSEQYVEVFKLRDEISKLDNSLNELYSLDRQAPKEELESLWLRRLKATESLKAVYTSQYKVVRI